MGSERRGEQTRAALVEAMRAAVAKHGAAGTTFERVAEQAGVSRAIAYYHFGSKKRFLAEAVLRDAERRALALAEPVRAAQSLEEVLEALGATLRDAVEQGSFITFLHEVWCEGRRDPEVREALARMLAHIRTSIGAALAEKQRQGVLSLTDEPEAVVSLMYALAEGYAFQHLTDPDCNLQPTLNAGEAMLRWMLTRGRRRAGGHRRTSERPSSTPEA